MKAKVTNKYIRSSFDNIFYVNDSRIEDAVRTIEPFAYNCGVFGWNCNFYEVDNVCISIGNRPIGKAIDYKIIEKYRRKIEAIQAKKCHYILEKKKLNIVLHMFIKEVLNNYQIKTKDYENKYGK